MRTHLALVALVAAAAPLRAQADAAHRYDAGSFVIELPAAATRLTLVHSSRDSALHMDVFAGGNVQDGVVLVYHTWIPDSPQSRRAFGASLLPPATPREIAQVFNDTSVSTRRMMLHARREAFSRTSGWTFVSATTREIVSDGRLTLRSPVTVRQDGRTLVGTADMSLSLRPGIEGWIVVHAARVRSPEFDAAGAQILDSFHPTGRPTPAETASRVGETSSAAKPR